MISPARFQFIHRNISRHISLTKSEAEYFRSILTHRTVRRRHFLVEAGEPCRFEHYVLKGCLRSFIMDRDGFEHVLQFAIEDWWTSDLSSLLTGAPATQTIEALEDTEVLMLERQAYDDLCERVPAFNKLFRILLQNAYVAHERRILGIIGQTAEERYEDFITRYPALVQRIPQKHIAAYLGITPEFLSRIRGKRAKR